MEPIEPPVGIQLKGSPGHAAKQEPEDSFLKCASEQLRECGVEIELLERAALDQLLEILGCERGFFLHRRQGAPGEEARRGYPFSVSCARIRRRECEDESGSAAERFSDIEEPEFAIQAQAAQLAFESEGAVLLRNPAADPAAGVKDHRSILCLPLRTGADGCAAIYLDRPLERPAFTEGDRDRLEEFSRSCSAYLEKAYLLRENESLRDRLRRGGDPGWDLGAAGEAGAQTEPGEAETPWSGAAGDLPDYHGIVGKSQRLVKIFEVVEKIKSTDFNICILGESGTGKELLARAIHQAGKRSAGQFISENCGAISETLLESELFGHVKGAFTGADENRQGLFELAHGGTLFLDEIGDMSEGMQRKLLRVLQEGLIRPIGSKKVVRVDVRVICASNRDLRLLVEKGIFRADLYYRLNVITIELPPLRERMDDLPLLIETILREIEVKDGVRRRLSESAMRAMLSYAWPGNIRELANVLRRLMVDGSQRLVTRREILPLLGGGPARSYVGEGAQEGENQIVLRIPRRTTFNEIIEECEKAVLLNALKENRWNKSRVTKVLRIPRQSLYNKIARYELRKKGSKKAP